MSNLVAFNTRIYRRSELLQISYLLLIITAANEFFRFGWWWAVPGVFNVADVGNALMWLSVAWMVINKGTARGFWNPIAVLIVFYLFFVLAQIALGSLYYGQPLITGFIGARHQFYYGSFFLFWIVLDDLRKIKAVIIGLIILGVVATALGVVNYVVSPILSHEELESDLIRSGIERAYIPGMALVSAAMLAASSMWVENPKVRGKAGVAILILLSAHIIRQTRMRLFGVLSIVFAHLLVRKKYKLLLVALLLGGCGVAVLNLFLQENILLSLIERTEKEISSDQGSISGRIKQIQVDMKEFLSHPIMGSGTSTLRPKSEPTTKKDMELWLLAYKADLGYTHWVKAYGVIGFIWLGLFFGVLLRRANMAVAISVSENMDVASFAMAYLVFVITSFVTLNHLMFPQGIVLVCLVSAIIVRLSEPRISS